MKPLFFTALCVIALAACNRSQNETNFLKSTESTAVGDLTMAETAPADQSEEKSLKDETSTALIASADAIPVVNVESKIIRNATLRLQVESVKEVRKSLLTEVKKLNGYLESEHSSNNNYNSELQLTLRVPNTEFDKLIDASSALATYIESKDITTEDVTDSYVDITARLKTKKEVFARYTDFLKRADKIKDVLEVENQIRQLQEEIESTEARLRNLNNRVSYSTINVTVYELKPTGSTPEISYLNKAGSAFVSGWRDIMAFTIGIIKAWPILIFLSLLAYLLRMKFKKRITHQVQ